MARPSAVSVVPLARSFWKWKSSTPPNAPLEVWCRFWSWAVLPLEMKPPVEKSIQLLKELVPPSNICSGVRGAGALAWGGGAFVWGAGAVAWGGGAFVWRAGAVAWGALVSAAQRPKAGKERPS